MIHVISFRVVLVGLMLMASSYCYGQEKWKEHNTLHFVIYYKDTPLSFVKSVARAAEDQYREISVNLGFRREQNWMSDSRAKIYIYPDAQDYAKNSGQYQWSHGTASAAKKTIRTFPSAAGFFDSTLPHELGHIIFREFIGLNADVPLWLEEGVAMHQETAKRVGANTVVKQAIKNGKFISLKDLTDMRLYDGTTREVIDIYYAQSASIIQYLINDLGEYKFVKLCRELKAGNSFLQALQLAYGRFKSLDDLNRGWMTYLEKIQ